MLAQAIAERSASMATGAFERIGEIYLSPDAFAQRTVGIDRSPSSWATCSRTTACRVPAPADDDRVGGWMLMYQMLEQERWIDRAKIARG